MRHNHGAIPESGGRCYCHNNVENSFYIKLMSEDIPKVEPIDIPKYNYKNSKYEMMPNLPARMLCVASSTGGKTVSIQNLILKLYRGSFERIYIFSPKVM